MAEGMCKGKSSMGSLFRSYSGSSYKINRGIWQQIAASKRFVKAVEGLGVNRFVPEKQLLMTKKPEDAYYHKIDINI